MKMTPPHGLEPRTIDISTACGSTDELTVLFFECPACEFSKVPYCGLPYPELNQEEAQTRFCPGCGVGIEWTGTA